ncbi:hypothetical protein B0H66DRAFT_548270 [Apodospora peruviana]|uniref:Uncharacterized protein n=1 Tax=Apodospora peruviana TaxID=516989 RepID=A0AAE0IHX3_9PEZI|nr:hypothetical protein B0H66DRAFT_548270 [Apodospora peruviana]
MINLRIRSTPSCQTGGNMKRLICVFTFLVEQNAILFACQGDPHARILWIGQTYSTRRSSRSRGTSSQRVLPWQQQRRRNNKFELHGQQRVLHLHPTSSIDEGVLKTKKRNNPVVLQTRQEPGHSECWTFQAELDHQDTDRAISGMKAKVAARQQANNQYRLTGTNPWIAWKHDNVFVYMCDNTDYHDYHDYVSNGNIVERQTWMDHDCGPYKPGFFAWNGGSTTGERRGSAHRSARVRSSLSMVAVSTKFKAGMTWAILAKYGVLGKVFGPAMAGPRAGDVHNCVRGKNKISISQMLLEIVQFFSISCLYFPVDRDIQHIGSPSSCFFNCSSANLPLVLGDLSFDPSQD